MPRAALTGLRVAQTMSRKGARKRTLTAKAEEGLVAIDFEKIRDIVVRWACSKLWLV